VHIRPHNLDPEPWRREWD